MGSEKFKSVNVQAVEISNSLSASLSEIESDIRRTVDTIVRFVKMTTDEETGEIKPELLKRITDRKQKDRYADLFREYRGDFLE